MVGKGCVGLSVGLPNCHSSSGSGGSSVKIRSVMEAKRRRHNAKRQQSKNDKARGGVTRHVCAYDLNKNTLKRTKINAFLGI